MPPIADILGFANRWYPLTLHIAQQVVLPNGRSIRLITARLFIGTKLEAFKSRGHHISGQPVTWAAMTWKTSSQ